MQDKTLSHLKIPRDFLNRGLLAEYLVTKTPYLDLDTSKTVGADSQARAGESR